MSWILSRARAEVLTLEHGPKVFDDLQVETALAEDMRDRVPRLDVARVDDRHRISAAKARLRLGRRNQFGDLNHLVGRPTVGTAGDENHVGSEVADTLDLVVRTPPVIGRDDVHDDGTGPECSPLGAGRGHLGDHAGNHHLQSTAG